MSIEIDALMGTSGPTSCSAGDRVGHAGRPLQVETLVDIPEHLIMPNNA